MLFCFGVLYLEGLDNSFRIRNANASLRATTVREKNAGFMHTKCESEPASYDNMREQQLFVGSTSGVCVK